MDVNFHSAGGVVVNEQNQILLVWQRNDTWSFPKGKVLENEDIRETAAREITEETGIRNMISHGILQSYTRFKLGERGVEDRSIFKRITMYLFTTDEMELRPMDPRTPRAEWFSYDDAMRLLTHPRDREFLRDMRGTIADMLGSEI